MEDFCSEVVSNAIEIGLVEKGFTDWSVEGSFVQVIKNIGPAKNHDSTSKNKTTNKSGSTEAYLNFSYSEMTQGPLSGPQSPPGSHFPNLL